jgi:hypothetical protein
MNNKHQNMQKNKIKENTKININKPQGSTTYSKNKKSLEKMLREYQTFCKKYFGESTPIGSMTEERMNKLLEDENNIKDNKNLLEEDKHHFLESLKDNNKDNFNCEEICDSLPLDLVYNDNNILGNHKNNKNDYKQRNKILFKEKLIEKEETEKTDLYNDFEKKEVNIETEGENKNKDMIYSGYDKEKLNELKIYIDSLDENGNIIKINVMKISLKDNKDKFYEIKIKDLLKNESISKEEINKNIEDIKDKIEIMIKSFEEINSSENENKNEKEEEKVLDEDGEEYTF